MKQYKMTNFIIIALVVTAVYQTGQLWLEGTTSHNFFYIVSQLFSKQGAEDVTKNTLLATRYAVGDGSSNFSVYYPDQVGTSTTLQQANDVLREILVENIGGGSPELMHVDWKAILQNRCIIMQYDFMITMEEYLSEMRSLKNGQALDEFDYVTIVPARRAGEESKAYFINSNENTCIVYEGWKTKTAPILSQTLMKPQNDMVYISTSQKTGTGILRRNLFLPQWANLPYTYKTLQQKPAFEENGEVSLPILEKTAERFFGNFSVDWSNKEDNGNFIFSDSDIVLRYHTTNRLLEYYNYANYGSDGKRVGLLAGYQIACDFLMNDTSLHTNVYLSDVYSNNNEIVYYFDYAVENLPVYLSKALQLDIGAKHALEITVSNDSVKKYRRYAVNYEPLQNQSAKLSIQFIDALDIANRQYQEQVEKREIADVKNIGLGYYVDGANQIALYWFVNLYQEVFVIPTDPAKMTVIAEKMVEAVAE